VAINFNETENYLFGIQHRNSVLNKLTSKFPYLSQSAKIWC